MKWSNRRRNDMSPLTFALILLLLGTVGAAQTDNPMFWLLIGPAPFAVVFTGLVLLRQGFSPGRAGKPLPSDQSSRRSLDRLEPRASHDIHSAVLMGTSVEGEMNDENLKNRGPRRPLIFIVPAYGLIVAVNRDWCFTSQERRASRPRKGYSPHGSGRRLQAGHQPLEIGLNRRDQHERVEPEIRTAIAHAQRLALSRGEGRRFSVVRARQPQSQRQPDKRQRHSDDRDLG